MDALSEILRLARLEAGIVLDATAHEPWNLAVPASPGLMRAHLVLEGECILQSSVAPEATLRSGDLVLLPGGEAHLIGSSPAAPPRSLHALVRPSVAGELLPVRLGGDGPGTRLITLWAGCERHVAEPLLGAMPALTFVDLSGAPCVDWLADSLGLALSPSDAPFLGESATRSRLAEIVLVEAFARYVHSRPPGGKGWLAGLNDRYVGRALALVHGRPAEAWTVEKLGRQVGLSRSALAERFSDVMGEPIMAFLTRWRLQMAARALASSSRRIEAIAREAGYESANSFARAFKQVYRKPPSVWRRKRRR